MENLELNFFKNKRVLVTGSTGFKGSWLSLWLYMLGAEVKGISLEANETNENFINLNLQKYISQSYVDIRNYKKLNDEFTNFNPEIIFHLAAQPIVIESYENPFNTYETNVLGTLNVFEAAKNCNSLKVIINVTSDKCYRNVEKKEGYVESDPLGGLDPYSASKSCAEIIGQSYIYNMYKESINIANVRAGNVIGGGDLSKYRLFTDIINSLRNGNYLNIRNPYSTRPWQYVLEPLYGYLILATKLYDNNKFCGEWNFGPSDENNVNVKSLIDSIEKLGFKLDVKYESLNFKESILLNLNTQKANKLLSWYPKLNFHQTLEYTLEDYFINDKNFYKQRIERIKKFMSL